LILFQVVVNMPRKAKPIASPDEVWIAPRPASQSRPRTFEPVGAIPSNRYLEFADIALGTKQTPRKKKNRSKAHENTESKVTPINRARTPRFGAFRNPG